MGAGRARSDSTAVVTYGLSGPARAVRHITSDAGLPLVSIAATLTLIFGGCCSNVYVLESIINFAPGNGTLVTFVQFLFVAITGFITQFDWTRPPFFITPNKVPLHRWLVNIVLFFSINMLNNHAFSYEISVPVHIILRSGGSITTMAAGYIYGKRYSQFQVLSVLLLSIGISLAAWSDIQGKTETANNMRPGFNTGLIILVVAQVLSAIMGLYTETTYRIYGPQWRENLFYSHILSLPLFIPFAPSMARNLREMAKSKPFVSCSPPIALFGPALRIPRQLVFLTGNVLTQYACIRGVNLLAAKSSALTVTIILNTRKLVSLLISIWLFGNVLAPGTVVGAGVVFAAGALYSMAPKLAVVVGKKKV